MNKPPPGQGTEPESSKAPGRLSGRIRFGPSRDNLTGMWSPMPQASAPTEDTIIEDEAKQITRALMDQGQMSRHDLHHTLGTRYWGPGRFARALRYALEHGMLRKVGRDHYDAPQPAPGEKKEENQPEIH
ncbi:MAG TPA: hypothetical protein VF040_09035 [Ktedonobacterales bacterium]